MDFIAGSVHSVFLNGKGLAVADVVDGSRIRLENLQPENQVHHHGNRPVQHLR